MADVTTYNDSQVYAKYLKKKCSEHEAHSHSGCEGCSEGCGDDKCSCCPPGLVAVYDDKGNHNGCLTPNDAEKLHAKTFTCQDGFIKLYQNGGVDPEFLGCVAQEEYAAIYAIVNPVVV